MDGLGFLYNNYLMDYDYKVFSHPLYLRPNAVPWATVAPTLIFRGKAIWMAVGRPGSERIFSAISQFLIHVADEHQSIGEAMYAPRLHCSLGGRLTREIFGFGKCVTAVIETPIARAIVDVNRASDDRPPENPDGAIRL